MDNMRPKEREREGEGDIPEKGERVMVSGGITGREEQICHLYAGRAKKERKEKEGRKGELSQWQIVDMTGCV